MIVIDIFFFFLFVGEDAENNHDTYNIKCAGCNLSKMMGEQKKMC